MRNHLLLIGLACAASARVSLAQPAAATPPRYAAVEAFRTTDGLALKNEGWPVRVVSDAAQPEVFLIPRATPSRNGPDAGSLLVYAVGRPVNGAWQLIRVMSIDQGRSWSKSENVVVNGWPKNLAVRGPVGPSAVQLEDGRIRLYFMTSGAAGARPRDVPIPVAPGQRPRQLEQGSVEPAIEAAQSGQVSTQPGGAAAGGPVGAVYSAISNDGLTFAFEDGIRFELAGVSQPEVVRLPAMNAAAGDRRVGPWLMFLSREGSTILATSRDGLTFERDPTFALSSVHSCTAELVKADTGQLRLWGIDKTGVVSATYDPATGDAKLESGVRMADADGQPADPSVASAGDGSFILVCSRKTADKPVSPAVPDRRTFPPTEPAPKPVPPPEPDPLNPGIKPRPTEPDPKPPK